VVSVYSYVAWSCMNLPKNELKKFGSAKHFHDWLNENDLKNCWNSMSSTYLKLLCDCFQHFSLQLPFMAKSADRIAAKDLVRLIPQVIANKNSLTSSSNFYTPKNFLRLAANRRPSDPSAAAAGTIDPSAAAAAGAILRPISRDLDTADLTDADLSENELQQMIRSEAEVAEILKREKKLK